MGHLRVKSREFRICNAIDRRHTNDEQWTMFLEHTVNGKKLSKKKNEMFNFKLFMSSSGSRGSRQHWNTYIGERKRNVSFRSRICCCWCCLNEDFEDSRRRRRFCIHSYYSGDHQSPYLFSIILDATVHSTRTWFKCSWMSLLGCCFNIPKKKKTSNSLMSVNRYL